MASNSLNVRAWIAPNGVFLCGDTQFASMCGIAESELVGWLACGRGKRGAAGLVLLGLGVNEDVGRTL